jgi:hypothetical protein
MHLSSAFVVTLTVATAIAAPVATPSNKFVDNVDAPPSTTGLLNNIPIVGAAVQSTESFLGNLPVLGGIFQPLHDFPLVGGVFQLLGL